MPTAVVPIAVPKEAEIFWISIMKMYKELLQKLMLVIILHAEFLKGRLMRKFRYSKAKYREIILDAAETVLGLFGFDRAVYSSNIKKKKRQRKWYDELREERTRDIQIEMLE